jgi:hypothetical protein
MLRAARAGVDPHGAAGALRHSGRPVRGPVPCRHIRDRRPRRPTEGPPTPVSGMRVAAPVAAFLSAI